MIRFHLDEHVDPSIAVALWRRGIDVSTAFESGLLSASDDAHVEFAYREHRIIVTSDADFLRLHRAGCVHAGIVYLPRPRTIGEIVDDLALMNTCLTADEMNGQIEYL